MINYTQKS